MHHHTQARRRSWLYLISLAGVIVPRRLRADWRQEWEAELGYREATLREWDQLDFRNKLDLLSKSLGALLDALMLQPRRLEEDMFQDLRYAARMLLKERSFTLVAVLSLALGIGANTAIFSLLDALLLRSLPVEKPNELVLFGNAQSAGLTNGFPNASWDLFSYPFFLEAKQHSEVFSSVAAVQSIPYQLHGSVSTRGTVSDPEKLNAQLVSGTYFQVLGVKPSLGRLLTEADDQVPGGHPVIVISYSLWEKRFAKDPAAVGSAIAIADHSYTVIGVTPRDFFGTTVGQAPDIWVPLAMDALVPPNWSGRSDRLFQSLFLIARLKDGVEATQAGGVINLAFKQFLQQEAGLSPSADRVQDIQRAVIELTPAGRGLSELRSEFSLSLRILMVVVAMVLLIACANLANLLLARAAARQREFAVRLAVGAGRLRLVRQLLTEGVLLASLGGLLGIALAWAGSRVLVLMVSSGSETLPLDVTPNLRVLSFTLLVSLISALLFGLAPALRAARIEPNATLRGKGAGQATSQTRFGRALVVSQVALSLVLLVGAGLFVRTLINLENVSTGFDQRNVLLLTVDSAAAGYKEDARLAGLLREVEQTLEAIPGVKAASFSMFAFNQGVWSTRAFASGFTPPAGRERIILNNVVGPDFFEAMGLPIVAGRGFGPQDSEKAGKVAVISESMAHHYFPGTSPLGRRFGLSRAEQSADIEVIGVVKDARFQSLQQMPRPVAYHSFIQRPSYLNNLEVRIEGAPNLLIPQLREAIKSVNRNLAVDDVVSLSEHVGRSLVREKTLARLATFFGALALLLACVGLYGVMSYSVARRTNEIGVRVALGARNVDVLWLVMRGALGLVLLGVGIGLAGAFASTRFASSLLFGLAATDTLTLVIASLTLISVATVAGYLPARRAAEVDPMAALRED